MALNGYLVLNGGRILGNGFNIQNVYHLLTNDPNKWQKAQRNTTMCRRLQMCFFSLSTFSAVSLSHSRAYISQNKLIPKQ